jgi:hypothetical protein
MSNLPGLKVQRNRDGSKRLLWRARGDAIRAGYMPKNVRLHHDADDPAARPLIAAACQKLQAEMLEWLSGQRGDRLRFDGTVMSLVRRYQVDPASPYRDLKWNTRRTYDQVLGIIERAFGQRALTALHIGDFRRWYDEAKKPKAAGGKERIRKAHGIISMFRRLFGYGITAELKECARLAAILDEARFKQPARRRVKLECHHAEAFIAEALRRGHVGLALGTALQFETTLRQKDCIGEWEPIGDFRSEIPKEANLAPFVSGGIVLGGRRWVNGLTWSHISADLILRKETTKTGQEVAANLNLLPLVMDVLAHVPAERRVGPVIIDENEGRPYAEHAFAREWRIIARAAGVPDKVWNMDSRSGGLSEADDAGAELDHMRSQAGHSNTATTLRYVRGSIGKSETVAKLRQAHRARKQEGNR